MSWNPTPTEWAHHDTDCYFRVYEGKDSVAVGLNARSTVLDADGLERVLRGYEKVVLAHDEPATDLRVSEVAALLGWPAREEPAVPPSNQLVRVDGDVVDLDRAAAEQALAIVVAKVNGLDEVQLSDSYPTAGGRVMRIPRVLELLAEQGWHGLTVYQLASARPLSSLAASLRAGG